MSDFSEIKSLLEQQQKAFHDFKTANDARLAQVEKGAEDAVTSDEVKKINDALDGIADKIKDAQSRQDEMEARMNRPGLSSNGTDDEAKALAALNGERALVASASRRAAPKPLEVEDFRQYQAAFKSYLRHGLGETWSDTERKALSVGVDPAGGYLVTPTMSAKIVRKIFESSPIRQIADVQRCGSDVLEGSTDRGDVGSGWVGENTSRTETDTPELGEWRIPVHEQYANPKATQKSLDDSERDLESWLAGKVGDRFGRQEASAFVNGNGTAKPRGFLTYTTAATADATRSWGVLQHVATGTSGSWGTAANGADKLIDLVHSVKTAYRNDARFVMNRATVGSARKIKTSGGDYVWLPTMMAGQPSSLLGYPVTEAEDMPDVGADSLSVAFGNFMAGYVIADRRGITTLRDPYTNKPHVHFYSTMRVGGDVVDFDAIKLLKFGS